MPSSGKPRTNPAPVHVAAVSVAHAKANFSIGDIVSHTNEEHKHPADRVLIASARVEGLTIVTADKPMLAFARTTGLPRIRA